MSELYHRGGDLENAIAWIQEARKLEAGASDVALEEKERSLTLEYYDDAIDKWNAALSSEPDKAENKQGLEGAINARSHST